jgi:hypothetical protein
LFTSLININWSNRLLKVENLKKDEIIDIGFVEENNLFGVNITSDKKYNFYCLDENQYVDFMNRSVIDRRIFNNYFKHVSKINEEKVRLVNFPATKDYYFVVYSLYSDVRILYEINTFKSGVIEKKNINQNDYFTIKVEIIGNFLKLLNFSSILLNSDEIGLNKGKFYSNNIGMNLYVLNELQFKSFQNLSIVDRFSLSTYKYRTFNSTYILLDSINIFSTSYFVIFNNYNEKISIGITYIFNLGYSLTEPIVISLRGFLYLWHLNIPIFFTIILAYFSNLILNYKRFSIWKVT